MNIQDITDLLLHYKYLIMFVLMFFELPVVGFISAFLAAKGYFNFGMVYLLSISGDVAGDLLRYRIGR
jgi:membrane protein DedA with SNARE-associated domain